MTKIDQNRGYVGLAYNGTDPQELYVDTSTGRLLLDIKVVSSHDGDTPSVKRDQNYKNVVMFYDDTNDTAEPALCDADGLLICDVVVE